MKKSFKVVYGFNRDQYIEITKQDLPKAYYGFLTEGKIVFSDGHAMKGRDIIRIEPNWNAVMGWHKDYVPKDEDFYNIGEQRKRVAIDLMMQAKEIAKEVSETKNINLLSQPFIVKEIESSPQAKELADMKRIGEDKRFKN